MAHLMLFFAEWIIICTTVLLRVCDGQLVNLAQEESGASCRSSVEPAKCGRAIDGRSSIPSATYRWDFHGNPVGEWIQIDFPETYSVSYIRIEENIFASEKNLKDIELKFSDNSSQQITLTNRLDVFHWEQFDLTRVTTTFVRLTFLSSYGGTFSSISEIEIYAENPGFTTDPPTAVAQSPALTSPAPTPMPTPTPTPPTPAPPTPAPPTVSTPPPPTPSIPPQPPSSTATSTDPASSPASPTPPTPQPPTASPPASSTAPSVTPSTTPSTPAQPAASTPPPTPVPADTTGPPDPAESTEETGGNDTTMTSGGGRGRGEFGKSEDDDNEEQYIIYGIIFGVLGCIVIAGIIVAIICCRKDRHKKKAEKASPPVANGRVDSTYIELVPEELRSTPVRVEQLAAHIERLSQSEGFRDEFADIPSGELKAVSDAKRRTIINKNRFNNIFPYNENRVRLRPLDDSDDHDYINASVVAGYAGTGPYIAAQGPNDLTIADFYRMIWERNISIVVMLTNLEEKGRKKCSQYWPDVGSVTHGEIGVKLESVRSSHHYVVRTLQLSLIEKSGPTAKTIQQYHFTTWPDEGVPQTATDVIAFHEIVMKEASGKPAPLVIHCSAGVGRTGTLIALDSLLRQAEVEGLVDVQRFVHQMRRDRMNMVQSLAQYRFIYHCLVEKLRCKHVSIPREQFQFVLPIIMQPEEGATTSIIEQQYSVLEIFKHNRGSVEEAISNNDKNRDHLYLPEDDFRPALAPHKDRDTLYISAVFAMSYQNPFGFFITTMPLPNTITEFWRLAMDYNICTIVMLNPPADEQLYWPAEEEDERTYDIIKVRRLSVEEGDIITTTLEARFLTDKNRILKVKHFQLKEMEAGRPRESSLLALYLAAAKWRARCNPSRILVHCMTGVEISGLFCATDHIVEKINAEKEVDVFNAVKKIRVTRPELITTLDQYQYLYRVADEYLQRAPEPEVEDHDDDLDYDNVSPGVYDNAIPVNRERLPSLEEEEEEKEEKEEEEEEKEEEEEEKEEEEEEEEEEATADEDNSSLHHLVIDIP